MIGKIKSGQQFRTAIEYITAVHREGKKSTLLTHSDGVLCTDAATMAACLEAAASRGGHSLESPVKHISLSFHPNDAPRMTGEFMEQIAREYMAAMGISDTEFVICRHHDQAHPHCHIVFSRVNRQGRLVSESRERKRNVEVCRRLTEKYQLYMPKGKERVNTAKLRGDDKNRYAMMQRVLECRDRSYDWQEFEEQLKSKRIRLKFRYNNVNGRLMGVAFSDGERSYSGKRLDNSLTYAALSQRFGDLRRLAHDNVRNYYEGERSRLTGLNHRDSGAVANLDRAFPPFSQLYPGGVWSRAVPDLNLLATQRVTDAAFDPEELVPSVDRRDSFVGLGVLVELLLQPYHGQLAIGGGGGGNDRGWRDRDDDRERFRFNFRPMRQQSRTKGRGR